MIDRCHSLFNHSIVIGHHACQQTYRTLYYYAPKLFRDLESARVDGSLTRLLTKLMKVRLQIIELSIASRRRQGLMSKCGLGRLRPAPLNSATARSASDSRPANFQVNSSLSGNGGGSKPSNHQAFCDNTHAMKLRNLSGSCIQSNFFHLENMLSLFK